MNTEHGEKGAFWRSPAGIALGVFLVVAGLLLVLEHGAHLLGASPLLLLLGVCVGMHFFMHGGHGSHKDDDHAGHRKGGDDGR
jgi:hypothetical protein